MFRPKNSFWLQTTQGCIAGVKSGFKPHPVRSSSSVGPEQSSKRPTVSWCSNRRRRIQYCELALAIALFGSGCSLKRFAINKIGDSLASGPSVYETEEDIALAGEALPFGLKFTETLVAQSPEHRGLLLTACKGFVLYSYAYVDFEAEVAAAVNLDRSLALQQRALKLYERAHDYGLRGLERSYPGIGDSLFRDPEAAAERIRPDKAGRDLPLVYWTAAALGLAISAGRNDPALLARLPEVEAMIDRAIEIDPSWDEGALYEFQVSLAGAKPKPPPVEEVQHDYERALALSGGKRAGLHLSFAESVSVPEQNRQQFLELIDKALAVDPDAEQRYRLVNNLAHRRARWLRSRVDELFLEAGESTDSL